jgi:hypothetical protein
MLLRPSSPFMEEYCIVLGQICLATAELEWMLFVLLSAMLKSERLAMNFVFGAHLDRILAILSDTFYAQRVSTSQSIAFENLRERIRTVGRKRNDNIHARWFFDANKKIASRWKFSRHKQGAISTEKIGYVDLLELEQLVNEIETVTEEVSWFRMINFPYPNEKIPATVQHELKRRIQTQNQLKTPTRTKSSHKLRPKR